MDIRCCVVTRHRQRWVKTQRTSLACLSRRAAARALDQCGPFALGGIDDRLPEQFLTAPLQRAPELVIRFARHPLANFLLIRRRPAIFGYEARRDTTLEELVVARHDSPGQVAAQCTDEILTRLLVMLRRR